MVALQVFVWVMTGFFGPQRRRPSSAIVSALNAALPATVKPIVIVCCLVVATSACAHPGSAVRTSTEPASAIAADSLVVSLDEVRRITGSTDLKANPSGDEHRPRHPRSDPPGPCRVFDPKVAFGSGWTQFRSVVYNGFGYPTLPGAPAPTAPGPTALAPAPPKPLLVIQTIGVYADVGAARTAFEHLAPELRACAALHAKYYEFTVSQPDPATVTLNYSSGAENMYRMKSSVLIYIAAAGFPHSEHIADTILQTVADRIR
jgi:hypothetical protein